MLVKERMSSPVITIKPEMPVMEALELMRQKTIRRTPIVNELGNLVGIVSDKDLLNAGPSDATALSVWELNYLLTKVQVKDIMTRRVFTVNEDTPIEEAARIMAENKIGGLPVMRGSELVGLITETDLFKAFLEMMGAQEMGVRVTVLIPEKPGELNRLTHAISKAGGSFISFGQFMGTSSGNKLITFKVKGMSEATVRDTVLPFVTEVLDIRTSCVGDA